VTRIVVGVIGAAVLAACGTGGPGPIGVAPPTWTEPPIATGPAAGFDVLITDQDQDITVRAGQKVEVYLRARPRMTIWAYVRSDNTAVLSPISTGITAARGVTIAGFSAAARGVTNITATAGHDCAPATACPMYAVLYSVRVTVT